MFEKLTNEAIFTSDKLYDTQCKVLNREDDYKLWVNKIRETGSCYRLMLEQERSFIASKERCDEDGAELLVIDNEVEHEVVRGLVQELDPVYEYFYTDIIRRDNVHHFKEGNKWYTSTKHCCQLFRNRHLETLHEIAYAPWASDNVEVEQYYEAVAALLRAKDAMYVQRWNSNKTVELKDDKSPALYGFCEKRVAPRPPY
ncbi:uncharacterized protein LOC133526372 isoform X2 [Cydia pomonella]|uniref:uncharacterized protein LOC133526372 isoform X2 n=1 Tax=Cydia pomonella TaxID=82600 RepID=UPI002ADDE013|nr:uncharacterized protein LOC133526372 isoform X2 [Cydia pomonella]